MDIEYNLDWSIRKSRWYAVQLFTFVALEMLSGV